MSAAVSQKTPLPLAGAVTEGDVVQFTEPGFPLTGVRGKVELTTPYTALIHFENGRKSVWPKHYFTVAIQATKDSP